MSAISGKVKFHKPDDIISYIHTFKISDMSENVFEIVYCHVELGYRGYINKDNIVCIKTFLRKCVHSLKIIRN